MNSTMLQITPPLEIPLVTHYPSAKRKRIRRPTQPSLANIAHPTRKLEAGQTLYEAGLEANCLYIVRKGMLKGVVPTILRHARISDLYGEGDILGIAVLDEGLHAESVIALEDCELTPLDAKQALKNHAVRNYIIAGLSKQLRRARVTLNNSEFPVGARLTQLFVHLAERFGKKIADSSRISLPLALTHEDLASLAGSSRVTVTRILGELRQQDALEGTRGIYQVDVAKLEQLTDDYVMQVI